MGSPVRRKPQRPTQRKAERSNSAPDSISSTILSAGHFPTGASLSGTFRMPLRRLHPSARTTRKQRRQIQQGQDNDRACAKKMGLNVKTVAKWRRRTSAEDAPKGSKTARQRALTADQEVLAVAVRQLTWVSLDVLASRCDSSTPGFNRTSLYRTWRKWGVSRTPRTAPPPNFPFAHRGSAQVSSAEPFQLRVLRINPEGEAVMMFVVGEDSGWTFARFFPSLDAKIARHFIEEALFDLKASDSAASMTLLTTPYHWAFCIEGNPANNAHLFCKFCAKNNVERRIATVVPTEIPMIQKGWPGVAPRIKTQRRRKLAAQEGCERSGA
jgi:transposase